MFNISETLIWGFKLRYFYENVKGGMVKNTLSQIPVSTPPKVLPQKYNKSPREIKFINQIFKKIDEKVA